MGQGYLWEKGILIMDFLGYLVIKLLVYEIGCIGDRILD